MIKKTIRAIHDLRLLFLSIIIVSFFYVIGINPVNTSQFIGSKIGRAVGMSVSIPENPFNKLAVQLKEKEEILNQRENELNQKAEELNQKSKNTQSPMIIALMIGIVILFLLVLINYYLDYRRRQTENTLKFIKK